MENYRKCFKCGCSPAKDKVKLFRFPKPGFTNLIRCTLWAKYVFPEKEHASIVFLQKIHNEHRMLCQRHFRDEDFVDSTKSKLLRTAIPCDVFVKTQKYLGTSRESEYVITMLYLKACRACLVTEGKLEKINEKTRKVFLDNTGLQINPGDGLPQYLCVECSAYIKKSMVFRKRSRRAHFVLKEIVAVKKQVTQNDILTIDRNKTNLLSTLGYWKPQKNVCYYYNTCNVQETAETYCKDNWGLDNAEPFKQDYQTTSYAEQTNTNTERAQRVILNYTLNQSELKPLDIYSEKSYNIKELKPSTASVLQHKDKSQTTKEDNKKVYNEFVKESTNNNNNSKYLRNVLNISAIVTDIKPDNYKVIERETEKRQRDKELALEDINMEDINNSITNVENNFDCDDIGERAPDIEQADIDMEDIFKGLPEGRLDSDFEWAKSEDEMDNEELLVPPAKDKQLNKKVKRKRPRRFDGCPGYSGKMIVNALAGCSMRYLTMEEQKAVYKQQLLKDPFKSAMYKCEVCVATFPNMAAITAHVLVHNKKLSFSRVCPVCLRRFEHQEELHAHCANTHWYEYTCRAGASAGPGPHTHHSLLELATCWAEHSKQYLSIQNKFDEKLKMMFNIQPLKQDMFGLSLKLWTNTKGCVVYKWRGRLSCGRCKVVFNSSVAHRRHMEQHETQGRRRLVCDVCGVAYARKAQDHRGFGLAHHMRTRHMYTYQCNMCHCKLYNRSQALYHLNKCSNFSVVPKESRPDKQRIYCNMCAFCTRSGWPRLYDHQLHEHGYFRMPSEPALHRSSLKCTECNIYFCKRSYLNLHYIKEGHSPIGALDSVCSVCGESFGNVSALEDHTAASHPRPGDALKCTTCEEVFVNTWSRNKHIREKHPSSRNIRLCEVCGKVYNQYSFIKHASFHKNNEEPNSYGCQFCVHRCCSAEAYVCHVLSNHTLKPYCCTVCGVRFHGRCDVRDHILKNHAPCRPYRCAPCDHQFAHLDYLHDHCLKVHKVNLKKTDKSVFHDTHLRKIFVYEHMKIDGSFINQNILARVKVERCDYMEHVFEPVDYREAFFFDPTVDPDVPTLLIAKHKRKKLLHTQIPYKQIKLENKLNDQERKRKKAARRLKNSRLTPKGSTGAPKVKQESSPQVRKAEEGVEYYLLTTDYVFDETQQSTGVNAVDVLNTDNNNALVMPELYTDVKNEDIICEEVAEALLALDTVSVVEEHNYKLNDTTGNAATLTEQIKEELTEHTTRELTEHATRELTEHKTEELAELTKGELAELTTEELTEHTTEELAEITKGELAELTTEELTKHTTGELTEHTSGDTAELPELVRAELIVHDGEHYVLINGLLHKIVHKL